MMNRDVLGRQMFEVGGTVPFKPVMEADLPSPSPYIFELLRGLEDAMRGSTADVAKFVRDNSRDLAEIAETYPKFAPIISSGFSALADVGAAPLSPRTGIDQMMTPVNPPQGGVTREFIPPGPGGVDPAYGAQNKGYDERVLDPNAPLSPEDLATLGRMRRSQELERGEAESFGVGPSFEFEEELEPGIPTPPFPESPGISMAGGGVATPQPRGGVATPQPGGGTSMTGFMGTSSPLAQLFRDHYVDPGKRAPVLPSPGPITGVPFTRISEADASGPSTVTMVLNNFRRQFGREPQDSAELRAYAETAGSGAQANMALGGEPMAAAMSQMGGDPMGGMMGGDPMGGMMGGAPMGGAPMGGDPMGGAPMAAMGAPPPADLGAADMEGIASQVDPRIAQILQGAAKNFGDPETAGSFEEMMNMVRGDQATEEERRSELAEMVGAEDAERTPDSVLALVQPMVMMVGAESDVDSGGIGPMAQEAMDVPIDGDMAGGIMSMTAPPGPVAPEGVSPPVNFNQGGEVLRFENGNVVPAQYDVSSAYRPQTFFSVAGSGSPYIERAAKFGPQVPAAPAKRATTQDLAALARDRAATYKEILGDSDAAGDKDLAQAQFYTDLAKFGFSLMQPGKEGENVLAQAGRAANEVGLGQNTLTLMAKQRAARKAADRQIGLSALSSSEAEMTAANKAAADASQSSITASATRGAAETKATALVTAAKTKAAAMKEAAKTKAEAKEESDRKERDRKVLSEYNTIVVDLATKAPVVKHQLENGDTVSVRQTQKVTRENGVFSVGARQSEVVMMNGVAIIDAKFSPDSKSFANIHGDMVLHERTSRDGEWKPVKINDEPLYEKRAANEWISQKNDNGGITMTLVNAITKTPIKGAGNEYDIPAELELREVSDGGKSIVLAINKTTGVVNKVFAGNTKVNFMQIRGNLITTTPDGKSTVIRTFPDSPVIKANANGQLGQVTPATPATTTTVDGVEVVVPAQAAKWVALDGSSAKEGKHKYATWVNQKTKRSRLFYTVNDGKTLFDAQTGAPFNVATINDWTRISDDTAFESVASIEEARLADEAYNRTIQTRFMETVQMDPEEFVDKTWGVEIAKLGSVDQTRAREYYRKLLDGGRQDAKELARLTGISVEELARNPIDVIGQIQKGTGFMNRLRILTSKTGSAIFNTTFWSANVEAQQFVRKLSLDLRIAAANSPRFAEGEQSRLGLVVAEVDKWITTGNIELNKLKVLKRGFRDELQQIRLRLANGTPGRRLPAPTKTVKSALQTAEVALVQGLQMLDQIPEYGSSNLQRSSGAQDAIDAAKAQQQGGN